ncbi:odorant receptor 295 [Nasonia vitripennis]|uniref:Odorant receptor n=1 Tax=Nasonia vitripennis TaxID=7425 RepID=A0A7M6W5X0_NASVI|nr:odorant receptor 295 [Nasonia vitripennis]
MGLIEVLESRKIFLWICGLWPKEYQHKPKLSQMKLYFIWFNMLMMCLLVFAGLVAIATPDNIPQASIRLPRKRMMKVIMETLKLEETSKFENDNDLEIIRSWRRTRDGVLKYHMRIYGFISVAYCFLPIISQVNTYPAQTIIQASLFVSPWYEFFYGFHCAQLFLYLFIIIATDGLSMILIFKLCEELQRFECLLFERHRADDATLSEKYKSRGEFLRCIIRKHCTILDYGESICNLLTGALFTQYFLLSGTLCFSVFTILSSNSSAMANQMSIMAGTCIVQLFMISLAGELVSTRSLALADALLQSDFCCSIFGELKSSELRQTVLMQLRMQKPLKLSIGTLGVINIEFFSRIMKGVYSFTMLLRTSYV